MDKASPQEPTASDLSKFGFDEGRRGVHTSRTMMLAELETVLAALPSARGALDVRTAIVEGNVLGKATRSGRKNSAAKLIDLYSFDRSKQLFIAFHILWHETSNSRPLLAVLFAQCRDAVLRASAPTILSTPIGGTVSKEQLYLGLLASFSSKYAETTLQSTTRNIASSWRQSGHLRGETKIVRTKAQSDFYALSFAVLIGYLRGLRGQSLLTSDWIRLLDLEHAELEASLSEAHRHGLVTSRKIGEVIDIHPGPGLLGGRK